MQMGFRFDFNIFQLLATFSVPESLICIYFLFRCFCMSILFSHRLLFWLFDSNSVAFVACCFFLHPFCSKLQTTFGLYSSVFFVQSLLVQTFSLQVSAKNFFICHALWPLFFPTIQFVSFRFVDFAHSFVVRTICVQLHIQALV